MNDKNRKNKKIETRVSSEELSWIEQHCEENGISKSDFLRALIREVIYK